MIPPFYISMQKHVYSMVEKAKTVQYEYVRQSEYDSSHYCQTSLAEQIQILGNQYPNNINIILIDDNIGTGRTIRAIKQELLKKFTNITTCALECRWDTKLYNADYPAFQLDDVDLVTPLCYRYYKTFDEQIAYIKNDKKLHKWYENGNYYKLNMVYDKFDYYTYINNNCADNTTRERILNIYENFKYIEDIIYNFNL